VFGLLVIATGVGLGLSGLVLLAAAPAAPGARNIDSFRAANGAPSWTDACPPSVLALALMSGIGAIFTLFTIAHPSSVPFFGIFLPAMPSQLFNAVMAAVTAWGAWALYRMRPAGWWTTIVSLTVGFASWLSTQLIVGPDEWARHMNAAARTPEQSQALAAMADITPWFLPACTVSFLAFAIWTGRHFWSRARSAA
jgi:hypothetical protein